MRGSVDLSAAGKLKGGIVFTDKDIAKFHSRYERGLPSDCWLWTYHALRDGRGRMWAGGRNTLASHIALHLAGSPRPDGMFALHSCDCPACVNPAHLRWGTQGENISDRSKRGRDARQLGSRNASAKLSESDIPAIRSDPRSLAQIARDYGVNFAAIHAVKKGRAWRHVAEMGAADGGLSNMPGMQSQTEEEAPKVSIRR